MLSIVGRTGNSVVSVGWYLPFVDLRHCVLVQTDLVKVSKGGFPKPELTRCMRSCLIVLNSIFLLISSNLDPIAHRSDIRCYIVASCKLKIEP